MATIYGAFRTDTNLTDAQVTFDGVGSTFEISAYSQITFHDGADGDIQGDNIVNEAPDDPTQTYLGNAIIWDFNYQVSDGTNTYTIAILDHDASGNGTIELGPEAGMFIAFIGAVPPLNTTLTITAFGAGAFGDPTDRQPISSFVPCFAGGTELETASGLRLVETLKPGDRLTRHCETGDGPDCATVVKVFRRRLPLTDLMASPKLRPVCITAGSLGNGLPVRDLWVSRQHRMLVKSKVAKRMFGVAEVLIPAIKLTALPGIFVDNKACGVEYFHILFDRHEVIYAEGAPSESLFTGPIALQAISAEAREEILTIFPEISEHDYVPEPARLIPEGRQQSQLVARHAKNKKPLLA